jgi:mRNA interferase MazF
MSQRFQRGAVLLIRFPFTDLSGSKRRPAVLLAEYPPDVVVAFISSVIPARLEPSDVLLRPAASTGLKNSSVLRLHKLATLEDGLITRRLGQLGQSLLTVVDKALMSALGVDPHPLVQAEYQKLATLLLAEGDAAVLSAIRART